MNTNSFINSSEAKPDGASSHITKSHLSGGPSQGGREIQTNVPLIAGPYELRPVVTFENMRSDMKEAAFEIAEYAVRLMLKGEKRHFRELAEYVKKEFDNRFPGTWHVIVGKNFGSYVSFESKCIILFWYGSFGFLIWKHG